MIRSRALISVVSTLVTAIGSGCSEAGNPLTCPPVTSPPQFDVNVIVRDSVTRAPTARGATLIARDGAYSDSVTVPLASFDDLIVGLVQNRVGAYAVTVRKNGYLDWLSTVTIAVGACGIVKADTVTARLQAAPPR